MKRFHLWVFLMLACVLATRSSQAQFMFTPDVVDKINIVDISDWQFAKAPSRNANDKSPHYYVTFKVQFENTSQYHVVFKDPKFQVRIRSDKPITPPSIKKVTLSTKEGNIKSEGIEERSDPINQTSAFYLHKDNFVRLPDAMDIKLFDLNIRSDKYDEVDVDKKTMEFSIPAAGKDGKPSYKEIDFVLDCGPAESAETTDHLLLKVFNTITGKRYNWGAIMKGSSIVGCRGITSNATVYSPNAIDIEIAKKPPVKIEVNTQ